MAGVARSCVQSLLKLLNSVIGMAGVAIVLYALWMFWVWQKHVQDSDLPAPWFIYTILGPCAAFCAITCSGHLAAETANGCCRYCYMVFVFLIFMVEAAVTVDVFVNRKWEEDFPEDTTGNFNEFKGLIRDNFEICKWIGLSVVAVQVITCNVKYFGEVTCLLEVITYNAAFRGVTCFTETTMCNVDYSRRVMCYDSDDDYTPEGVPLLKNYVHQPSYVVGGPLYGSRNNSWKIRVDSKVNS